MRDIPMLFNGAMVRAIMDGRKTVTRRPAKFRAGQLAPPPCVVGDRGWVRETISIDPAGLCQPIYRADGNEPHPWGWTPSIHMPKRFARLFLPVISVRAERIQGVTAEDALAEGVATESLWTPDPREEFRELWQSIYGAESWENNAIVWRMEWGPCERI